MSEFAFEESPWEKLLKSLKPGDSVSAEQVLTMTEGEEDSELEFALGDLAERGIRLDITGLPKNYGTGEAAARLRREEKLTEKRDFVKDLDENDPLRLYLEEVMLLPKAENIQMLAEKAASGNEKARNQLANALLPRVVELARDYVGRGVLMLDLIQEGSLGLWNAVQSFTDGDFAVYADEKIRFSFASAVTEQARNSGVGQKLRCAMEDYRSVDERLLSDLGRNPTVEEIAEEMHMSAEEAARVGKMLTDARRLQNAKGVQEEPEDDPEEDQTVENTALFQSRQRIADLLSELSDRDAKLISLRFGLEGGLPMTPEETGKHLGLTPEEVVAREAKALALLRGSKN